jgi:DNA-binding IclR family transcriptional regulator
MELSEPGKRIRGKRPPEGKPVVDRAFSLLAAFDAGHRRLTLRELSRQRHPGQLNPAAGGPEQNVIPPAALRRTLAEVRRERLAIYRRLETEPMVAVAAPILGEHEVAIAAIGVVLPERVAQPRRLGYAVRTAAQSISRQLGAPSAAMR